MKAGKMEELNTYLNGWGVCILLRSCAFEIAVVPSTRGGQDKSIFYGLAALRFLGA